MMSASEKVAYLKGLAEGMGVSAEDSNESKLILAIIDALEEIALDIQGIEEDAYDLSMEVDAISEDLADVEALIYDEDDDTDDEDYDEFDADDDYMYYIKCPACDNEIEVDASILETMDSINCPNCGERLEFVTDDYEDDE